MDTLSRPARTYTTQALNSPDIHNVNNVISNHRDQSSVTKPVKLSKRVNARLQLAAALIEADNEDIEEKNAALGQFSTAQYYPQARQPKLASESAIFAPYRDPDQHANEVKGDRRILSSGGLDSEGRPVIDFLGVKLPAEKRQARSKVPEEGIVGGRHNVTLQSRPFTHASKSSTDWPSRSVSQAGSNLSMSRPATAVSRPLSQVSMSGGHEVEEEALSEWGVEKFLSSEARQRIETGKRSRANSVIERPESAMSGSSIGRAHSEIGTEASPLPQSDLTLSKLDLLARIKLYREGQKEASEEIQKETEDSLYPSIKDDRLHGHLKALTIADGSSVGVVSQAKNTVVDVRKSIDLGRALSKSGIMGDSWSEQGDDPMESSTIMSQQTLDLLNEETSKHLQQPDKDMSQTQRSAPIKITRPPRSGSPVDDMEQHEEGMAGIGSFSRSPRSRPPSFSGDLLSPPLLVGEGRHLDDTHPSNQEVFPRPRSAYFVSRSSEPYATTEVSGARRQSIPYLAMPGSALSVSPNDTSPRQPSMLNPAYSPRLRPSPDAILASIDPYFDMAGSNLSPYPTLGGSTSRMMEPLEDASETTSVLFTGRRASDQQQSNVSTYSLSTRQLQEFAKQNSFPASFGLSPDYHVAAGLPVEDAELLRSEQEILQEESDGAHLGSTISLPVKTILTAEKVTSVKDEEVLDEAALQPIEAFVGANQEPDLSSARWGRKKRKSLLAKKIMLRKATLETAVRGQINAEAVNSVAQVDVDIDNEYVSPPTRGPLRPQGIECRLPSQLKMPPILAGTSLAPKRRLLDEDARVNSSVENKPRVPAGFVLHNRTETVSMKVLAVQGASGAKPFFMSPKGRQKHDHLVSNFLQSQNAKRLLPVPVCAPPGIGRRAAMNTTALFRNQLVHHEEEKEGWGWEVGSRIGTELVEVQTDDEEDGKAQSDVDQSKKKLSRKEKKLIKKMLIEKRKRKEARRTRRKKRELAKAKNMSLDDVEVEELSPDEDLDLSETSSNDDSSAESDSEVSSLSQGEARWIDENRPAGRLYGKSLLDVVDERKKKVSSKARYYGQVRTEDLPDDGVSILASSIGGAPSFRDNRVEYNDTRERMEAMFGPDQIWAKEMAKRKLEEAEEAEEASIRQMALAELEAEENARKEVKKAKKKKKFLKKDEGKSEMVAASPPSPVIAPVVEAEVQEEEIIRTSMNAPTIHLDLPQDSALSHRPSSLSGAAAQWLDSDGSEDDDTDNSDAEANRRMQALQRARMSRSLGGLGQRDLKSSQLKDSDDEDEEDNVPLSTLRSKLPPATLASQLNLQKPRYDSEEEEVPLSQLVANRKKKTQSLGTLDLNFMLGSEKSSQKPDENIRLKREDSGEGDEDEVPIGLKLAANALVNNDQGVQHYDEDDSDNEPLGKAHPQAAVITEQANIIKHLQSELIFKQQQQQMMAMPGPYAFPNILSPAPYSMPPMHMMPVSFPQMIAPAVIQQQDASIAMWAASVDPDAENKTM